MSLSTKKPISPAHDPWEAYLDITQFQKPVLSNIELTTTTLCNMRCEHCAVGYTLSPKDPDGLPIQLLINRLEQIPHLRSLSITGGEPMLSGKSVENYVLPLLKYAHQRGVYTQINSNLTLDISRYEKVLPFLDVLHISHNWGTETEFIEGGFARMERKPSIKQREALFRRIIENSRTISESNVLVSAETMLNKRTLPYLEKIHRQITEEMKCQRHEIHPMYPSDFASSLESLSLEELRYGIKQLLDFRDQDIWMLFGTLPFYGCSNNTEDLALLKRLYSERNVTIRNDPDGRSRLNVNIFSGDVIVTDFGDTPPLGNIKTDCLEDVYQEWANTTLAKSLSCHCSEIKCLGPNILVKDKYYPEIDFQKQKATIVMN
ncbi:radical SAM/CxCxxxxC motif protein YfkAB [Mesobacillus maritimus]|uniref:Radical SAM/CxCxxxxC motif protein YfkAB n=1 Tax=Mesobacillus maritimus TaxID=1643336 RepID=A0ABS7K925_9BACI|nr:radical SAM/CxCxxxxC motif protein YfkAB [Mesobacillus maritimus]MBY0098725.1 radical SAM/CxCxxxxC motif protein YfkAB [Mesobacillus maritimus]